MEARLSYVSCYKCCHFWCGMIIIIIIIIMIDYLLATFPRILAAFAGLYNHIRKLFNLGCFADVVKDG